MTPQDAREIAAAAIGGAAETVLDQPYMQGISNLVDVMRHPKELRYWSRFSKDIATGFVPGAGMLRYIEQIKDPTVREGKTIPEKLQAGIPGMSASRAAETRRVRAANHDQEGGRRLGPRALARSTSSACGGTHCARSLRNRVSRYQRLGRARR